VIVRDDGLGVPQTAHSALAGRLAAAWRIDDDLPAADLRTAATVHDIGWTAWERAPEIDPSTGRPFQFFALPAADHAAIWTLGTDAASTFGRWVDLLVSLHCSRLMGWRERSGRTSPEVRALLDREAARQERLREGLDPGVVDRASELILAWDGLSLDLCFGREVTFDAWPFALSAVDLAVDARRLDEPPGETAWTTLSFALAR